MTKTKNKDMTFEALQVWRRALQDAICIKSFEISDDGKTFDYQMKDKSEYDCKDCVAFFCFKSLEWMDSQEYETSKQGQSITPKKGDIQKEAKSEPIIEPKINEIPLPTGEGWEVSYV